VSATVYDIITDRMVALLEKGIVPWHKPWIGGEAQGAERAEGVTQEGTAGSHGAG
jgi:antirestriction protein ArdC